MLPIDAACQDGSIAIKIIRIVTLAVKGWIVKMIEQRSHEIAKNDAATSSPFHSMDFFYALFVSEDDCVILLQNFE